MVIMMIRRSVSLILIMVIASGLMFPGVAAAQDSEREFAESIVPGLKALREFSDKVEQRLARFSRLLGSSPRQDTASGQADSDLGTPETAEERAFQERLRREFIEERTNAHREQNQLVENTRRQLRLYVSLSVDSCKKSIADRDEPGARANCGIAETRIDQCRRQIAPEINQLAEKLNARYRSYRDSTVAFATIHCDLVFSGLDDPGMLLRRAEFRLPDSACYAHIDRVVNYVKTGVVQSRLGADDASVPAYLSYIRRMCPESISAQARLAVNEAGKAKEEADRKKAEEDSGKKKQEQENKLAEEKNQAEGKKLAESDAARSNTTPPAGEIALPRRGGGASTALLQSSIDNAIQEERDRPAREAREREERAREAAAEAKLTPAERLARSFDQRISAARQQCAASERSCNSGCLGVAAVGIFSALAGNSAGVGAASEQTQQCSNRCDQAKSDCEQQVAALEREKSQAINGLSQNPLALGNASGGGVRASGSQSGAQPAALNTSGATNLRGGTGYPADGLTGNECLAERALLVNASYQRSEGSANQAFDYYRNLPDHPNNFPGAPAFTRLSCTIVPGTRDWWRSPDGSGQHVVNCYQQNYRTCLMEARYGQIQREKISPPQAAAPSTITASGNCKAAYDRQEAEFAAINRRAPRSSNGPVIPGMQVGMYMTSERLKLLDRHCRGQPQYAEYSGVKQQYDGTLRACRQIATDAGDCAPRLAY